MARLDKTKTYPINQIVFLPCSNTWQRDSVYLGSHGRRSHTYIPTIGCWCHPCKSKVRQRHRGAKKEEKCREGWWCGAQGHSRDPQSSPSSRGQWRHMTRCRSAFCPVVFQAANATFFKLASQIATQHAHAQPRVTFNTRNTRNAAFAAAKLCFH